MRLELDLPGTVDWRVPPSRRRSGCSNSTGHLPSGTCWTGRAGLIFPGHPTGLEPTPKEGSGRMRRFWMLMAMAALLLTSVRPAHADPTHNPNVSTFTLQCGDATLTVGSPTDSSAVALALNDHRVVVASVITERFVDPVTRQDVAPPRTFTYGPGHGHANGLQEELTTCTQSVIFDDPDLGTVELLFSFRVFFTPGGP